jgi:hypothetical protein
LKGKVVAWKGKQYGTQQSLYISNLTVKQQYKEMTILSIFRNKPDQAYNIEIEIMLRVNTLQSSPTN